MLHFNRESRVISIIILVCIVISTITFLNGRMENDNFYIGVTIMVVSLIVSLAITVK